MFLKKKNLKILQLMFLKQQNLMKSDISIIHRSQLLGLQLRDTQKKSTLVTSGTCVSWSTIKTRSLNAVTITALTVLGTLQRTVLPVVAR